jgi:hypothetical protein
MYRAKLYWNGKKLEAKDYQLAINRIARGTMGISSSTPLGTLIAESSLTLATVLCIIDNHTMLKDYCSNYRKPIEYEKSY